MLSPNENIVRELLEAKLTGNARGEAQLYHSSVLRKLKAVQLFYNNITSFIPSFFTTATASTTATPPNLPPTPELIDAASLIDDVSAYIDAFFMSGKSTLDSFAHELRSLYQFTPVTGDLYFENALDQLSSRHSATHLNTYLTTLNIRSLDWYRDLTNYRRACTHESIIPFRPSFEFDVPSGRWLNPILKLPQNPGTYPPTYADKDFYQTGQLISEGLKQFIIDSYDHILTDILAGQTTLPP